MGAEAERGSARRDVRVFCPRMQFALPFDAPSNESNLAPAVDAILAPGGVASLAPEREASVTAGGEAPFASAIYFIRHRRAKRYLLRVDQDGRVRVTIPRGGSRREAEAFAARHEDWVARQRSRQAPPLLPTDERRRHREQARAELPPRLLQLAALHGLDVRRVSIRSQKTRWGSCGRDAHICLNWRLVLMPEWVRDYVLIHELMHLRRLDHSPQYWKLVSAAFPRYREARQWLRQNGPSLR
jgi:predicted metal-dependent hydrolase